MTRRWMISLSLVGLLALVFVPGCGSPMTEQQKVAMGRLQDLGARINTKRGGYEVDLTNTQVQDKDLANLKDIPNLLTLDLGGTQVTDACLDHLRPLTSLELVILQRTLVSNAGIEGLRKSLPKATVRR